MHNDRPSVLRDRGFAAGDNYLSIIIDICPTWAWNEWVQPYFDHDQRRSPVGVDGMKKEQNAQLNKKGLLK